MNWIILCANITAQTYKQILMLQKLVLINIVLIIYKNLAQ